MHIHGKPISNQDLFHGSKNWKDGFSRKLIALKFNRKLIAQAPFLCNQRALYLNSLESQPYWTSNILVWIVVPLFSLHSQS